MSLDPRRAGPALPGVKPATAVTAVRSPVTPLAAQADPLAGARKQALWWTLGAVGVGALALVLRPWLGRLTRRTPRGRRRGSPDSV